MLVKNKPLGLIFATLICCSNSMAQSPDKLHQKAIVVDTHNDFISKSLQHGYAFDTDLNTRTHSDLTRMKAGGIDVQIFSIWGDENIGFAHANREIDTLYAIVARNPSTMALVRTSEELQSAIKHGQLAAMIGVEGGHMIEDDLNKLDQLIDRGACYMTLTWNNSTSWASSAADEAANRIPLEKRGLNDFGKSVVRRMNARGMMVDLSHVGEQTFRDAMAIVTKPVIVSHSSVYALAPVPRNLKDDQIDAVGKNRGVICVNFFSGFLDSTFDQRNRNFMQRHRSEIDSLRKKGLGMFFIEDLLFESYPDEVSALRPPLSVLIDHIDYIARRIGTDHVGLGSDFDGINSAPRELRGVVDMPLITRALRDRGYSEREIRKILGGNVLRVLKENGR